jgi:hypothetical protein
MSRHWSARAAGGRTGLTKRISRERKSLSSPVGAVGDLSLGETTGRWRRSPKAKCESGGDGRTGRREGRRPAGWRGVAADQFDFARKSVERIMAGTHDAGGAGCAAGSMRLPNGVVEKRVGGNRPWRSLWPGQELGNTDDAVLVMLLATDSTSDRQNRRRLETLELAPRWCKRPLPEAKDARRRHGRIACTQS